jgi:hypothetical protein
VGELMAWLRHTAKPTLRMTAAVQRFYIERGCTFDEEMIRRIRLLQQTRRPEAATDEPASCVGATYQKLWLHGLWDNLNEAAAALDKAKLSDEKKARLRIAYIEALGERLKSGPPAIGERSPELTAEAIEQTRRELEALRQAYQRGEPVHGTIIRYLFPDDEERRLVELGLPVPRQIVSYSPEALEQASRRACEE